MIKSLDFRIIQIPLREIFTIATTEKRVISNVFVKLELDDGIVAYGEISPLFSTDQGDCARIIELLRGIGCFLVGRDILQYTDIITDFRRRFLDFHFAMSGLEIAIYDALARTKQVPLYEFFGNKKTNLEIDMTIGIASPEDTIRLAGNFLQQGFKKIKMKVGLDAASDLKRIRTLSETFKNIEIYLDANQGYSVAEAMQVIEEIEKRKFPVTLFEQPIKKDDWSGLSFLTKRSAIPIAADETVASVAEAIRVIEENAAHVINIKLAKTGILAALKIMALAQTAGLKLMIGGMLETKIGISASVHLACGSDAFSYHDLDTIYLLADYPVKGGFSNQGPIYSVKDIENGTGISDVF